MGLESHLNTVTTTGSVEEQGLHDWLVELVRMP